MPLRLRMILVSLAVAVIAAADYAAESIPRLETRVLGQTSWLADSRASLRIATTDHLTGAPVQRAAVRISLLPGKDSRGNVMQVSGVPRLLFVGTTNAEGTADVSFRVPPLPEGQYRLRVQVSGAGEYDLVEQNITIKREAQILLTTDKPLYQPGQVIHIRALALNAGSLSAMAGQPILIQVEDSKGNKVFKKRDTTSEFGVAYAEFQLADEINLGSYRITATVGKDIAERVVKVDRYVLPKFRVTLKPDKTFYMPGDILTGDVQADYFFGKPVAGRVEVRLATFDVGFNDFAVVEGTLDASGHFQFTQKLPTFFAGVPLEQGNAFVKIETTVTDTADHKETITSIVPVAKDPIRVTIVPESTGIVPKVPNLIYVVTSYPDGTPAKTHLRVTTSDQEPIETDADTSGIAVLEITPTDTQFSLTVAAVDASGKVGKAQGQFASTWGEESLLVRTDKAIYSVGQPVVVTVFSPVKTGTVYIDIVRNRQTALTKAAELVNGRADLVIDLANDLAGTLEVHAYRITRSGQIIRDTQVIFVNPANDLNIAVDVGAPSYPPGSKARIGFRVTDTSGGPVVAALGINIVDESVFALQDMQPGMEKVYFLLEKEILEPRYEIHTIDPGDIVRPTPLPGEPPVEVDAKRQLAAAVLFAALPQRTDAYALSVNTYTSKLQKLMEQWTNRVLQDAKKYSIAMQVFLKRYGRYPTRQEGVNILVKTRCMFWLITDQWGRPYDFSPMWGESYRNGFTMRTYGADGVPDTEDDIRVAWQPGGEPYLYGTLGKGGDGGIIIGPIWRNGVVEVVPGGPVPPPAPPSAPPTTTGGADQSSPTPMGQQEVRVRQFFPETLYTNPAVITDPTGHAAIDVDIADSITTWRISALASSKAGQLGSTDAPLLVFQEFFVDIDFPVALTQGDEVAVPVAVYNYLNSPQTVRLEAVPEPWFEPLGEMTQTLDIGPNEVKGVRFPIRVTGLGFQRLTVKAFGTNRADAVRREVEIRPNGSRVEVTFNDKLDKDVTKTVTIPTDSVAGASNILVKVYPGVFSQLVEGMDRIFQMPFGCFEQTSSTTYPNVLALDYMKKTRQGSPETQMKAEGYINLGYQRLLSYEVPGGGFSWFGNPPANKVLTAYGLMEFFDMSKVYEIDEAVITRTQQWLVGQQETDGSWKPDKEYLHEESWGRIQHNEVLPTAYITWALLSTGYGGPEAVRGVDYVAAHADMMDDPYTLGIIANALVAAKHPKAEDVLKRLIDMRIEEDGKVHWKSGVSTLTYAREESADIEATATIALALVNSGGYPDITNKVLAYLISVKDPNGTWHSTQATVLALKALVASLERAGSDTNAAVKVLVNGQEAASFNITPDDSDVMRLISAKDLVKDGDNEVTIQFSGKGSCFYQITGVYYMPWKEIQPKPGGLIDIDLKYDRTELETNEIVTAAVKITYNGPGTANMVIVDLGIPPGFDVQAEDFGKLVEQKVIQKYSFTGRQVILYFDKIEAGKPITFSYRLKAKYPLRATTPESKAYLYYNPEIQDTTPPITMTVR
ncbi:MAG: alpha-2-macroglobulin family protein [Armatimonadota bacterium]